MQAAELSELWQQRWGGTRPLFAELKAEHPSFRVRTLPHLFHQHPEAVVLKLAPVGGGWTRVVANWLCEGGQSQPLPF